MLSIAVGDAVNTVQCWMDPDKCIVYMWKNYPSTPDTAPEDFEPYGHGWRNKKDGLYWENNKGTPHGGRQFKRWKNFKSKEKGEKPESVWPDGRVRK